MTDHHLDQLEPTMDESAEWGLERTVVHVIDREADSLGRLRSWDAKGHLFLVRCDDRRLRCSGQSVLLSEINEHFHQIGEFQDVGKARFHGKSVRREVCEANVVLYRQHKETQHGKQVRVSGKAIARRLLIAAMACIVVNRLQASTSAAAEKFRKYLIQLSGRQIKYGQESTSPALLASYFVLLSMSQFIEHNDVSLEELKQLADQSLSSTLV